MEDKAMHAALEILRSGTLDDQELVVSDHQSRALRAAIDDLNAVHEALRYQPVVAQATNVFVVRG